MAANQRIQRRQRREIGRMRRPRVFPDRTNPLELLNEDEVFDRYRFRPCTIHFIMAYIVEPLWAPTRRNSPLPPLLQLLVTLRYLATGAIHLLVGDSANVTRQSVSRAILKVTNLLCGLRGRFINFPSGPRVNEVKRGFSKVAGFPNVLGCIDGTLIRLQRPIHNEADFVNRKGYHSLNVQMCCDHQFKITSVTASWPGSVHDSRIFRGSTLCAQFEHGDHNGFLLGDSGYPCRHFLLTPFLNPANPDQMQFNTSLCKTRVLVEQTFGILKRRFQVLHCEQRCQPKQAVKNTVSCAVLHNIGAERGDIMRMDNIDIDPEDAPPAMPEIGDGTMRDLIVTSYFSTN